MAKSPSKSFVVVFKQGRRRPIRWPQVEKQPEPQVRDDLTDLDAQTIVTGGRDSGAVAPRILRSLNELELSAERMTEKKGK
jgi:hypothetical protein